MAAFVAHSQAPASPLVVRRNRSFARVSPVRPLDFDAVAFEAGSYFPGSSLLLSPSLDYFYSERLVQSCPSKHERSLRQSGLDIASVSTNTPQLTPNDVYFAEYEEASPCGPRSQPMWPATPSFEEAWTVQQTPLPPSAVLNSRTVLSLSSFVLQSETSGSFAQGSCLEPGMHRPPPPAAAPASLPAAFAVPPPPFGPALGSTELPSVGSAEHIIGMCRPCAFYHTKGCEQGLSCRFCHFCGPEERKLRKRHKSEFRQVLRCQEPFAFAGGNGAFGGPR